MREIFPKKLDQTRRLHNLVSDHPDFEVVCEPTLVRYCFRYVPNGLADRQQEPEVQALLDRLNQEIVEATQRNGLAAVATTRVDARVAIELSLSADGVSAEEVDATFEAIARWGRLLNKTLTLNF